MRDKAAKKTTICSVLFLDIVEYTKKSVSEQIKLKGQFNELLSQSIKSIPVSDRVILDTGDGAAVSFLGDPEEALLAAMTLREALVQNGQLFARIGINLGPVRLVQDINGQPNMIGDGINVAQRIMSFAEPNQILVSRSYHDVVSCMTDEYAKLFEYQGSKTDKHVREHELYSVKEEFSHEEIMLASAKQPPEKPEPESAARPWWNNRKVLLQRVLPAAALLVTALAALVRMEKAPEPAPVQTPAVPATEAPKASAETAQKPVEAPKKPAAAKTAEPARKPAEERKKTEPKPKKSSAVPANASVLFFKISPWGEVYVDGQMQGISPPLKTFSVTPGTHRVEIKNTLFPSHTETVETKADEQVIIRHKFQ